MKRSRLGPGGKSLARGSTFRPPVDRAAKPRAWLSGFTPASVAQRAKVKGRGSIVSAERPCDPAHLWPRSRGGCDHPDCVVALTRAEHRAFDDGQLDLLPYLIAQGAWLEMAHMIGAHRADPISMLQRLTGERWAPEMNDTEPKEKP